MTFSCDGVFYSPHSIRPPSPPRRPPVLTVLTGSLQRDVSVLVAAHALSNSAPGCVMYWDCCCGCGVRALRFHVLHHPASPLTPRLQPSLHTSFAGDVACARLRCLRLLNLLRLRRVRVLYRALKLEERLPVRVLCRHASRCNQRRSLSHSPNVRRGGLRPVWQRAALPSRPHVRRSRRRIRLLFHLQHRRPVAPVWCSSPRIIHLTCVPALAVATPTPSAATATSCSCATCCTWPCKQPCPASSLPPSASPSTTVFAS